ncbi:MAG: SEL1-like repeat protein [Bacteroidaceae bacterium]|nr:SEL1-like repeat protein [Bacteroidaceae bacterium]
MLRKITYTALLLLVALFSYADGNSLDKMAFNAAVVNNLFPQERVYLHFDNTAYYLGETMWFKAYVTEGVKDAPSTLSKVLYVELVAPEGYVVETKKYKIDEKGTCNGEFELKPLLLSGYYEIRAYTRYMLNWGKEAVFSRVFPIFDKVNGNNWDFKNMLDRRRGFMYRGEWISSELPELDLKFYPEGGHLIEGIETTVAYELRGEDGIAGEDTIYIYAGKNLLQRSVPTHAGKGTFSLTPETGVKYHAEVKRGKKEHKFELPKIEKEGVSIAVKEEGNNVSIKVSNNLESSTALGCAVLHRGELSHYQKYYSDNNGKIITIDKDSLREGVNRVIVFVDDSLPLAERQFFVMHENIQPGDRETAKLKITANGEPLHKLSLKPHEKFSVTIEREDGKPIEENTELSLSVSDAAGRQQTSYTHNMYSYLLLGSELKGYIPDAARYFDPANKNRAKELDLLMLTNGWTSYDWSKLAKKDIRLYQPIEKGITVKGTFYKKEKNKKWGQLGRFTLIPQKELNMKFEICYEDSIVSNYEFATDKKGTLQLQTEDFYGKKIGAITPMLEPDQIVDSLYSFSLDRYYSPEFRLYDYWERHIGLPLTDKEKREQEAKSIKLRPFEYMLSSVEVTAAREYERYSRPPHSEMRFDYLDEWEYAQDVTFLNDSKDYSEQSNNIQERMPEVTNEEEYITLLDNETTGLSNITDWRVQSDIPLIKYLGNIRYWSPQEIKIKGMGGGSDAPTRDPNDLKIPYQMFPNAYTAADVVRSAIKRHNYNWAYWVQLMVVAGTYNSDSVPRPDNDYLKGKNSVKMTNFKEFVIRSDKGTREQFENLQSEWTHKGRAMDNKMHYMRFYMGFLSQMYIGGGNDGTDGYSGARFLTQLESGMNKGRSFPYNPNYVACMIPYEEGEEKKGIVPDLHTGSVKRYTSIQGYSESKQFYSPDYKGQQPSEKDFRRTLIWVPAAKATGGKATIELCNSSVAKEISANAEGYNNGTIYGSDLNILTRTLTDEQRAIANQPPTDALKNNPAMLAYCMKLLSEGQNLYNAEEYTAAFERFHDAAAMGEPTAIYLTGVCYSYGRGTEKDSIKAFDLYRSAANCGIPAACHQLANCYKDGSGTIANDSLALKWYTVAADSGLVRSMSMLAKSYDEGLFTEKNSEKAIEWYKKAAAKEEPLAMYKVARLYEHNDSLEGKKGKILRESETIKLFTRAAELGNVQAQMKLAELYKSGRYVKKSKKMRFDWLLHAANNGNIEAQELVGECYEKGRGIKKNNPKAYKWYKRAAEQGSELGKIKAKEYELFKFYR